MSGGFDGQVGVYGLPSGRLLKHVPVFSQSAENGWGYSEQTKAMLNTSYGFVPWDDAHHPQLSQTDGVPDGRWLFINGNNTPRIARLDLTRFETEEILEIPNSAGNHASPFVTENNEYVVAGDPLQRAGPAARRLDRRLQGERSAACSPSPRWTAPPATWRSPSRSGMPGFRLRPVARRARGRRTAGRSSPATTARKANTKLEVNASQKDKDYIAAINWKQAEQCVAQGKATTEPARYAHNLMGDDGIARTEWGTQHQDARPPQHARASPTTCPTPKSPHGVDVDPTGEFIVAGGKLATVIPVHCFSKMQKAIADKAFAGEDHGIPVLKYEATMAGEVQNPGLGPLHTEFDGKGIRLHVDVPELRDRQVEPQGLQGASTARRPTTRSAT